LDGVVLNGALWLRFGDLHGERISHKLHGAKRTADEWRGGDPNGNFR
jgi:hypothetical protein